VSAAVGVGVSVFLLFLVDDVTQVQYEQSSGSEMLVRIVRIIASPQGALVFGG